MSKGGAGVVQISQTGLVLSEFEKTRRLVALMVGVDVARILIARCFVAPCALWCGRAPTMRLMKRT